MKNLTLNILTLFVFLSSITFTFAQDASNNATWEETIELIDKNKHRFKDPHMNAKKEDFIFKIDKTTMSLTYSYYDSYAIVKCPLIELESATYSGTLNYLEFTSRICDREKYKGKYSPNKEGEYLGKANAYLIKIDIENDTDNTVSKYFQHLTFLAGKKR